jgi:hypothetical protein
MIIDLVRGDIFETSHSHIAFAINTEGFNDAGFAGQVTSRFWRQLANTGQVALGETFSKKVKDKTFHALVVHSLMDKGWAKTPWYVEQSLNKLEVSDNAVIAIVLMGAGMVGQMGGADVLAILGGMARSKRKVAVYTL